MKKLFLLSALAAFSANGASAQSAAGAATNSQPVVNIAKGAANQLIGGSTTTGTVTPSGKATVGGSRWYSYAEYCSFEDPDFINNQQLPYLWDKPDAMGIYSDGSGGIVADTIQYASYGMSFDPAFTSNAAGTSLSGYNEPSIYDKGSIVVRRTNAYTIDSVRVFGFYGRNTDRTAPVDTLRISLVYGGSGTGSDMPVYYFTGMTSSFGSDTVRFASMTHDTDRNIASGATLIVKDVLLTPASLSDTVAGGMNAFSVPVGMNVPAGNVVGIAVTFKTGDTYIPYVDTIFFGSARTANPFGRGMFRPSVFAQYAGAFPKYWPGYYNVGMAKFLPSAASWSGMYLPSFAFTSPDFTLEVPNIDVKVSCATCNTIQELSVNETNILDKVAAYPNPASTELNVPFTLLEKASVKVSVTNIVGQVIATQDMGQFNAGQKGIAVFSTTNIANGVYLYTVEANGQRVTNRFTVAH